MIERGANHLGEIAYTASMVRPDVALILNIGTAHLGEFGGRANCVCQIRDLFGTDQSGRGNFTVFR